MIQIILLIAVIAMAGCGKKDAPPETETKPKAGEAEKGGEKLQSPKAFTNTLGMKFEPVPETGVAFCVWETRVKDYATYAAANVGVDASWKYFNGADAGGFKQEDTHPVMNVSWNDAQAF